MHVASGSRSQSERLILLILCYFILDHANLIILHEAALHPLTPLFKVRLQTYLFALIRALTKSDVGLLVSY